MNAYSLSHLSDFLLLRGLSELVAHDRATTAALLAHIAEVDARKLYVPAAHSSMYAYCVHELRLSEEAAFKRIHAARTARRFPAIFRAVADGRLHLSSVIMLAPHLTEDTANELLAAAAHKSKSEVERLLAERFPRQDVLTWLKPLAPVSPAVTTNEHAPGRVDDNIRTSAGVLVDVNPSVHQPSQLDDSAVPRPRLTPLSPQRFALQVTLAQGTHDKLRHAQALLSHRVPTGDIAEVLDRALDALIRELEKQKLAASEHPQQKLRPSNSQRHIPAHVKRTVWERDGGQCTFVSDGGRRCTSRRFLEFDHVDEVARGGRATVQGMRLRCRAHNQFGAECRFGAEFMSRKRDEARCSAVATRAAASRTH